NAVRLLDSHSFKSCAGKGAVGGHIAHETTVASKLFLDRAALRVQADHRSIPSFSGRTTALCPDRCWIAPERPQCVPSEERHHLRVALRPASMANQVRLAPCVRGVDAGGQTHL